MMFFFRKLIKLISGTPKYDEAQTEKEEALFKDYYIACEENKKRDKIKHMELLKKKQACNLYCKPLPKNTYKTRALGFVSPLGQAAYQNQLLAAQAQRNYMGQYANQGIFGPIIGRL